MNSNWRSRPQPSSVPHLSFRIASPPVPSRSSRVPPLISQSPLAPKSPQPPSNTARLRDQSVIHLRTHPKTSDLVSQQIDAQLSIPQVIAILVSWIKEDEAVAEDAIEAVSEVLCRIVTTKLKVPEAALIKVYAEDLVRAYFKLLPVVSSTVSNEKLPSAIPTPSDSISATTHLNGEEELSEQTPGVEAIVSDTTRLPAGFVPTVLKDVHLISSVSAVVLNSLLVIL